MPRPLILLAVVVASAVVGYLAWELTGSTAASYMIGVAGLAVGVAALFAPKEVGGKLRAKVKVGTAEDTSVVGAHLPAGAPDANVDTEVEVGKAKGGEAIGIRTGERDAGKSPG